MLGHQRSSMLFVMMTGQLVPVYFSVGLSRNLALDPVPEKPWILETATLRSTQQTREGVGAHAR
jgi:hypothetical protein